MSRLVGETIYCVLYDHLAYCCCTTSHKDNEVVFKKNDLKTGVCTWSVMQLKAMLNNVGLITGESEVRIFSILITTGRKETRFFSRARILFHIMLHSVWRVICFMNCCLESRLALENIYLALARF